MRPVAKTGALIRGAGRKAGSPETRKATEVDHMIGLKLRLRRAEVGLTQMQLAEKIGVTFQQVQKYERGTNRIGGSRLAAAAAALGVPVSYFFDEMPESPEAGRLALLLREPGMVALLKAFAGIKKQDYRRGIVELVRAIAAQESLRESKRN